MRAEIQTEAMRATGTQPGDNYFLGKKSNFLQSQSPWILEASLGRVTTISDRCGTFI